MLTSSPMSWDTFWSQWGNNQLDNTSKQSAGPVHGTLSFISCKERIFQKPFHSQRGRYHLILFWILQSRPKFWHAGLTLLWYPSRSCPLHFLLNFGCNSMLSPSNWDFIPLSKDDVDFSVGCYCLFYSWKSNKIGAYNKNAVKEKRARRQKGAY